MVVKQEILRLKHFPEVGPPLDGSFRLLCARWGCKKENTYECQLKEGSLPVQKNIPAWFLITFYALAPDNQLNSSVPDGVANGFRGGIEFGKHLVDS